jgi:signal transduction histidine kinase
MNSTNDEGASSATPTTAAHRLPTFITENTSLIVGEWEIFARSLKPSSAGMSPLALRDHILQILEFIAQDMNSSQTPREQTKKSLGKKEKLATITAAETHAALRLASGFGIDQMVSEYRALRASVVKLWSRTRPSIDAQDVANLTRFNESIDQALAESVSYYTKEVVQSRDLLIGILSHDLRSPVQAIMLSAELILHLGDLSERQTMLARSSLECAVRISVLIKDLLDVTRARFGASLPVVRAPMDIGFVGHQVVDEMRILDLSRVIVMDTSGDLKGKWDAARIGQIFSNLISNAIQYGFKDTHIDIAVVGHLDEVEITVHNTGRPISCSKIATIFNPLTRAPSNAQAQSGPANLGLGLFITREIAEAHGGTISVASSEEDGTTFTVRLPRSKRGPTLHVA